MHIRYFDTKILGVDTHFGIAIPGSIDSIAQL